MLSETKYWDREVLYREVWTTPLTVLAKKYGLSDVGLAKICRRLSIPLPGRGYWAKLAAGKTVKQLALPLLPGEVPRIPLHEPKEPQEVFSAPGTPAQLARIAELESGKQHVVFNPLFLSHPLIARTQGAIRKATTDNRNLLRTSHDCLDIRVSKENWDRGIKFMATLLAAFKAEGVIVSVEEASKESWKWKLDRHRMTATVYEERIRFSLREKVERAVDYDRSKPGYWPTNFVPTGHFYLEARSDHGYVEQTWSDKKGRRIEDLIPQCVASFLKIALERKETARHRAEEQHLRELREQEKRRLIHDLKEELRKVGALRQAVKDWGEANMIRLFLNAVRDSGTKGGQSMAPGSRLHEWLAWAHMHADRLDPLKENPECILDRLADVSASDLHSPFDRKEVFAFPKPIWRLR